MMFMARVAMMKKAGDSGDDDDDDDNVISIWIIPFNCLLGPNSLCAQTLPRVNKDYLFLMIFFTPPGCSWCARSSFAFWRPGQSSFFPPRTTFGCSSRNDRLQFQPPIDLYQGCNWQGDRPSGFLLAFPTNHTITLIQLLDSQVGSRHRGCSACCRPASVDGTL